MLSSLEINKQVSLKCIKRFKFIYKKGDDCFSPLQINVMI